MTDTSHRSAGAGAEGRAHATRASSGALHGLHTGMDRDENTTRLSPSELMLASIVGSVREVAPRALIAAGIIAAGGAAVVYVLPWVLSR